MARDRKGGDMTEVSPKEYIEGLEVNLEVYRRRLAILVSDSDVIREDPIVHQGAKAATLTQFSTEIESVEWRIAEIERRLKASADAAMGTNGAKDG